MERTTRNRARHRSYRRPRNGFDRRCRRTQSSYLPTFLASTNPWYLSLSLDGLEGDAGPGLTPMVKRLRGVNKVAVLYGFAFARSGRTQLGSWRGSRTEKGSEKPDQSGVENRVRPGPGSRYRSCRRGKSGLAG